MVILSFKKARLKALSLAIWPSKYKFTDEYVWMKCDNCNKVSLLNWKNSTKDCSCNKPQISAIDHYKTTLICA